MNCTPSTLKQRDQESQESFPAKNANKHNPAQSYGMSSSPVKGKCETKGPSDSYETSHQAHLAFSLLTNHSSQILGKRRYGEDQMDGKRKGGKVDKTEKGPSDSDGISLQTTLVFLPLNTHSIQRFGKKRREDETDGNGTDITDEKTENVTNTVSDVTL